MQTRKTQRGLCLTQQYEGSTGIPFCNPFVPISTGTVIRMRFTSLRSVPQSTCTFRQSHSSTLF